MTMQGLQIAAAVVLVLAARLAAETPNQPTAAKQPANEPTTVAKRVIVVSLEDRKLALVEDGQVKKVYTVAVGKPSTPSPVGTFTIERRVMNPTYAHDGRIVPPGPGNPVGTRWMGLSIAGYGIHGTNAPSSIGKAASHGCIRMAKKDLEELYPLVEVGDTVELIGERNQETAELFGEGAMPAAAARPATLIADASTASAPAAATQQAANSATLPAVFSTAAAATLSSLIFAVSM
jgi:lipoprotein-anchoring transpeptidase ErfK/SrfK